MRVDLNWSLPREKVPGIYLWRIGREIYVGKATSLRSRLRAYRSNTRRFLTGGMYRQGDPDGWRPVHRALAKAAEAGLPISVEVLEFCSKDQLDARERYWLGFFGTLNGPENR